MEENENNENNKRNNNSYRLLGTIATIMRLAIYVFRIISLNNIRFCSFSNALHIIILCH